MSATEVQLVHDTGPQGGGPCRRCGLRYTPKTAYIPCFIEGDNLETWVARHAETLITVKECIPNLLHKMAERAKQ